MRRLVHLPGRSNCCKTAHSTHVEKGDLLPKKRCYASPFGTSLSSTGTSALPTIRKRRSEWRDRPYGVYAALPTFCRATYPRAIRCIAAADRKRRDFTTSWIPSSVWLEPQQQQQQQ